MPLQKAPVVRTQMLIRRPANDVFQAFVDPDVTARFWFTRSSGKLEAGKEVTWYWDMYGVSALVRVRIVDPDRRIVIEWQDMHGALCPVEWTFSPRGDNATLVTIATSGFTGSDDDVISQAIDSMGGFTFVLAGLKALLEHDIQLNLTADHNPDIAKTNG